MNNQVPVPSAQTQVPAVIQAEKVQNEAESAPIHNVVPDTTQVQQPVVEKSNNDNEKLNLLKNMLRSMVKNATETRPEIVSKKQESSLDANNRQCQKELPQSTFQKVINKSLMDASEEQGHHQCSDQQLFVIQVIREGQVKKIQKDQEPPQVMSEKSVSNHEDNKQIHPQQPEIENQAENNVSVSVPQQHEQEKIQSQEIQKQGIKEPQQVQQKNEVEQPAMIGLQSQQSNENIHQEKPSSYPESVIIVENQDKNAPKQQKSTHQDTQMKLQTPIIASAPEIPNKMKLMMQKMKKLKGQPQKIIQRPQQPQQDQQKPCQQLKDNENKMKQAQKQRVLQENHEQKPFQSLNPHENTEHLRKNEPIQAQQQVEDDQDGYQSEIAQQAQDLQEDKQEIEQQVPPKDIIDQHYDDKEGQQQQLVEDIMIDSNEQRENSRPTKKQQKKKKIMLKDLYTILDYTKKMKHILTDTLSQTIPKPSGKQNLREILQRIKETLIM